MSRKAPFGPEAQEAIARAARAAFDAQASDLADVASQCGASRIHIGDAADAAYNMMALRKKEPGLPPDFFSMDRVSDAFDAIKEGLRPLGFERGWYRF